jgi:hypothetical protein
VEWCLCRSYCIVAEQCLRFSLYCTTIPRSLCIKALRSILEEVQQSKTLGRSVVRISADSLSADSTIGYVNLAVFPTTKTCGIITFDSVQFIATGRTCTSLLDDYAVATVCSRVSCGTYVLSEYLRYNTLTRLSVWPNPAADRLMISSSHTLGPVSIELVDALGVLRLQSTVRLIGGQPVEIENLPPSGVYVLRIANYPYAVGKHVLIIR